MIIEFYITYAICINRTQSRVSFFNRSYHQSTVLQKHIELFYNSTMCKSLNLAYYTDRNHYYSKTTKQLKSRHFAILTKICRQLIIQKSFFFFLRHLHVWRLDQSFALEESILARLPAQEGFQHVHPICRATGLQNHLPVLSSHLKQTRVNDLL